MSRWFRFHSEALDDPKVQKLPPHLFKTWVNLLCMACQSDGILPRTDDMAFRLRISTHDAQQQIDELIGLGLVDIRADSKLEPHNWTKRQFVSDTSTDRVRKFRKSNKKHRGNVSYALHETTPEQNRTDSDTDSETEQKRAPPKFLKERLHEEFETAFKARASK